MQRLAALAWVEHAEGNHASALRSMRAAADLEDRTEKRPVTPGPVLPARELLGDLLMELDQPARALTRVRKSIAEFSEPFQCDLWRRARSRALPRSKQGARTLFASCFSYAGRLMLKGLNFRTLRLFSKDGDGN